MIHLPEIQAYGHPLVGRRIGVIGREGAGRTTLAVLLARELAARGYEVCFLDADSKASGPHAAFGSDAPLVSLLEFLRTSGEGPEETADVTAPPGHIPISLEELPGRVLSQTEEGICLLSLGKTVDCQADESCEGLVARIARDLRVLGSHEKPLTLIELESAPAASPADLLASLDWILVVVDPTFASLEVAAELRERAMEGQGREASAAGRPGASFPEASDTEQGSPGGRRRPGVMAVLNQVPDPETEQFFATALSQQALLDPIGAIREDWDVSEAGLHGQPVPEHKAEGRVGRIVDQIEEAEWRVHSEATA